MLHVSVVVGEMVGWKLTDRKAMVDGELSVVEEKAVVGWKLTADREVIVGVKWSVVEELIHVVQLKLRADGKVTVGEELSADGKAKYG